MKVTTKIHLITLILTIVGFILLVIGCSIDNEKLVYGSLAGVGLVYLGIELPIRMIFDEL